MEQGFMAAGIGILIALISYSYGRAVGKTISVKRSVDFSEGVKYGTVSVIFLLLKSKVINMDKLDGSDYTLTGNSDRSVTMSELTKLAENGDFGANNNDSI